MATFRGETYVRSRVLRVEGSSAVIVIDGQERLAEVSSVEVLADVVKASMTGDLYLLRMQLTWTADHGELRVSDAPVFLQGCERASKEIAEDTLKLKTKG